jgi:Fe-S-cluster-containing dehydrogenase component
MKKNNTSPQEPKVKEVKRPPIDRRTFLQGAAALVGSGVLAACGTDITKSAFFQKRFKELSEKERAGVLDRLKGEYLKRYGKEFTIGTEPAMDGVEFAYGLDLSRCIGCRKCVEACQKENNSSRDPQIEFIRVLRMEKTGGVDIMESDHYYNPEEVPEEGYFYMPVQCHQCRKPPCVKVCPIGATWQEPDGITVIDYNWCIGCRYCMAACPYGARHFNWKKPHIPAEELNTDTHYLGNRPRMTGVVEKCTFCIQRTRQGRYPACVEVCPVGARKFGNLLDASSEIRYIFENKRVFIFKEEQRTLPRFYYFYGT